MIDCMLYTPDLYQTEFELGHYIARLTKASSQKVTPVTDGLLERQPDAVLNACENSLSILTGPPGTGKTTTCKRIVQSFSKAGMNGLILGPTGKSAKRAKEVIADPSLQYSTVHLGLEYSPATNRFVRNRYNKLPHDYVLVDEFSMCDLPLMNALFEAIDPTRTRLVLVGDEHQLPSVGPGNFARDAIASGCIKTTVLDKIFRQGANSGIVHNASRLLRGDPFIDTDPITGEKFTDFFFVKSPDPVTTVSTIVRWVAEDIPRRRKLDSLADIQVLCPGKKAVCGTVNMNKLLREKLNPNGKAYAGFRIGDKVINTKNNYELGIVNGDVGVIKEIEQNKKKWIVVDFGVGAGKDETGIVPLPAGGINSLSLANAFTVHKSQGSEFPAVIIPLHTCHTMLLFRNLLYTGMTRGKQLTTLIGDPKALDICINTNKAIKRNSRLASIIIKACTSAAA